MRKKRVLINSDYPILKTGLARNTKPLSLHLHNSDKYEVSYYSCGMGWDSPDFKRMPFEVRGALPTNPAEQSLIDRNRDEGYRRACSYGLYYINRAVKEFKPDVLICSNDSWAFDAFRARKFWNHINVVGHVTIDSVPLMPVQVELLKNLKNAYVWSTFAEKEAHRLGLNHVKCLTGIVEDEVFVPLEEKERMDLRAKNGIDPDTFVVGMVGRNQLRKSFPELIEGFALYRKKNPNVKAKLHIHTNFHEAAGQGWPIPAIMEHHGVAREDLLATYVCRHCSKFFFDSYDGDRDCKLCGQKQTAVTANVVDGVPDSKMKYVYGLHDAYCHCMTNGGLEIPMVESLYCGVPIATVDYSSGEDFCGNPFVHSLMFTMTTQPGTQFRRAAVSADSVCDYMEAIQKTPQENRRKLGLQGRDWALKRFSAQAVLPQWEKVIDDLPLVDWDFNMEEDLKNPNYPFKGTEFQDDREFVKDLYKNVLRMHVEDDDSGLQNWLGQLQQVQ